MPPTANDTRDTPPVPTTDTGMDTVTAVFVTAEFGSTTHAGLVRSNNEDHFAVVRRKRSREILATNVETHGVFLPDDEAYVLIVADGVGGRGFGELASELVLRYGWDLGGTSPAWIMKYEENLWPTICQQVKDYTSKIQAALRKKMQAHPKMAGMGTTWTCVYTMDNEAIVCHAGDSRAYLYRQGQLRQLTHDHTFAQELQDVGMPESQTTRFKHILTNSFGGPRENVTIDVSHEPLHDGDRLLLCTDGLTDMVSDEGIASALGSPLKPQAVCDELQKQALAAGGKDNITIVVAEYRINGASA